MNNNSKRFGWIATGHSAGPDPLCDLPLYSNSAAVVVPTLGSIISNWFLVVPRKCAVSIAELDQSDRDHVVSAAEHVARAMGGSNSVVYFEHGPDRAGSVMGCGVDQAHLHVISTSVDFVTPALNDTSVVWRDADSIEPWSGLCGEYYLIKTASRAFVGRPREPVSQFFRRHIATSAGVPERWDYKAWPHYENIRRTYEQFNKNVQFEAV